MISLMIDFFIHVLIDTVNLLCNTLFGTMHLLSKESCQMTFWRMNNSWGLSLSALSFQMFAQSNLRASP